jgi:hypothetical protein
MSDGEMQNRRHISERERERVERKTKGDSRIE